MKATKPRRCVWARGSRPPAPQASVAAALAHLTRCIGGVMHHCKPWDVEDVASFTTHQRSASESSPVQSYVHFGDRRSKKAPLSCLALRAILAAAPSVFEQLSVGFDRFCGHVPLLQNSTFRTPCPSVVNADFQFGGGFLPIDYSGTTRDFGGCPYEPCARTTPWKGQNRKVNFIIFLWLLHLKVPR